MADQPAASPTTGGASKPYSAQRVIEDLVARGVAPHIAEGFALNAADESSFNPAAVGDNGNAIGVFQWNGPRKRALEAFAASKGTAWNDWDTQMDFVVHENATSEAGAWARIQKTTTRGEAAAAIVNLWERPAEVHRRNREAKYLGGLLPQGEYTGDASAPMGVVINPAAPGAQARMSITDPNTAGGMDITAVNSIPTTSYVSDDERASAEAKFAAEQSGFTEMLDMAADEQWIHRNIARQMGKESFAEDPAFTSKGFDDALWKEVTEGLPTDYHEVFNEAVSPAHARAIRQATLESYKRDQKLAQWGWTGVGAQMGASMLDPVAIGLSLVTEGVAAPVIYGAKVGKLGRAVRAGLAASTTNVALDSYLISQDPVGNWSDLTYSAAAGFLMGGAAGAFRRSPVDDEFADHMRTVEKANGVVTDPVINDGSVGAARATPLDVAPDDVSKALEIVGDAPTALMGAIRADSVGRLKSSPNTFMRWVGERFGEDAVGNKDGVVTVMSALEIKTRETKAVTTRFYREYNPAFKAWAKGNAKGSRRFWDPAVRAEFNSLVGQAVRRPLDATGDPNVQKVAAKLKQEYAELLRKGKEAGVKGFADLPENDLYLSRQWNIQSLDDYIHNYNGGAIGADRAGPLYEMLATAMERGTENAKRAKPGADLTLATLKHDEYLDLAKGLVESIRTRKYQALDVERAIAGYNLDALGEMLLDSGVSTARVAEITAKMTAPKNANSGKIGVARRRIVLDETWRDPATGLGVEDFLENDVEALFGGYVDSVMGEAAYQEVFRGLRLPNEDGVIDELYAPSYERVKKLITAADKRPADEVNAELATLDVLYRALKGIPQEPETRWNNFLRRTRSFNFVRVMGQLGVAQLSELGMIVGNGGMRGIIYHMPTFKDFILKAKAGALTDDVMNEIEAIWSPGLDVLAHSPHVRLDDGSAVSSRVRGGKATRMQVFDYGLNNAKQAVATVSGMTHINRMLQRFNSRVLVQRFVDEAFGQKGLVSRKGISTRRYEALGISKEMAERINAQIRSKVTTVDGVVGKKVKHINIDKWDDIDAKNAFINGVDRWSRRVIQENGAGSMPAVMTKEMAKSIGQFRTFMIGAYTKQLLAGVRQNDWETYSSFMASMFFGGLFYVGQTQINAIGRPDKEAWLDERLSAESIGKAAFQRAGFSTFMPMLVDMGAAPFTDEPIFAYRTTDLSTGLFGNPSVDLMNNIARGVKGSLKAAVSDDYDFSQQDARSITNIIPFQNAFVIRNLLAMTVGSLPKFSQ